MFKSLVILISLFFISCSGHKLIIKRGIAQISYKCVDSLLPFLNKKKRSTSQSELHFVPFHINPGDTDAGVLIGKARIVGEENLLALSNSRTGRLEAIQVNLPDGSIHEIAIKSVSRFKKEEIQVLSALAIFPVEKIKLLKKINFNYISLKKILEIEGIHRPINRGTITIYHHISTDIISKIRTLIHESGHVIDFNNTFFKKLSSLKSWEEAMSNDQFFVSAYAKKNMKEDFAETFVAYMGRTNHEYWRELMPNRFLLLDEILTNKIF